MKQQLNRTLGLFSCLTISVGTMIGSAIFVLAGTSFNIAGPSASLAIFLAGIAALCTGVSFAELVTIIPKAGGGYAYVREATNNGIIGFICGWGFWLSYAMSSAIFAIGFGNFINYFFHFLNPLMVAYLLSIYVVYINIKGTKSSGKLQDIITVGLVILLLLYISVGVFHVNPSNYKPYTPKGYTGMFSAMGLLYMTYIGYGLITTASEEVIKPEKTIPKSIIISIVFVIILKTATFAIGSGISNWTNLIPSKTTTPMTDTAVLIGGRIGGYLFAFAGILATLSSINTAVLASSRTSFALSRDRRLPSIFKIISKKTQTPIVAILVTGIIVIVTISLRNVERISSVTSIFSLIGYTFVNVSLMTFRKKLPDIEREFKAPFFPITPILGIILNVFMAIQLASKDIIALISVVLIVSIGLIYYYIILPRLKTAPKGVSPYDIPKLVVEADKPHKNGRKIFVPMANPETMDKLIDFSNRIAKVEEKTTVVPLHVVDVPETLAMDKTYFELKKTVSSCETIFTKLESYEEKDQKNINPLVVFSKDISKGILNTIKNEKTSMLLMGWHHMGILYNKGVSLISHMLAQAPADICILKCNNKKEYNKILFPYGGGRYSQLTGTIVQRVAKAYNAHITVVKIVDEIDEDNKNIKHLRTAVKSLGEQVEVRIEEGEFTSKIIELSRDFDLIILGASLDWGMHEYLTGLKSDSIAEKADCDVLIVKNYQAVLQRKGIRKYLHKVKEVLS